MYLRFEIDTYDTTEQGLVLQAVEVIDRYRDDMSRRKVAQQTALVDNVPPAPNVTESPELPPQQHEGVDLLDVAMSAQMAGVQSAPTEQQCITALRSMMDAKGFPAVRGLLDSFGVQRVGELSAQQRAQFVAKATTPAEAR